MYKEKLETNNEKLNQIKADVNDLPDFVDTTDGTATAEDIRKDMTAYVDGEKITGTLEVVEPQTGDYFVKVFDYDGTLLDEKWLNSGDTYTLPEPPNHERFEFEGWTCTRPLNEDNATITIDDDDVLVGAIYHTRSGACELDIELSRSTGLTFSLANLLNSTSVDWGDGNITTDQTSHTYSEYGKYTIKLYGDINFSRYALTGGSQKNNLMLLGAYMSNANVKFEVLAFYGSILLEKFTMANNTNIGTQSYLSNTNLKIFISNQNMTTLNSYHCNSGNFETIILNHTIENFESSCLAYTRRLENFVFPPFLKRIYSSTDDYTDLGLIEKIKIRNIINSGMGINMYRTKVYFEEGRTSLFNNFQIGGRIEYIKLPSTLKSCGSSSFVTYYLKYIDCRSIINPFSVVYNWLALVPPQLKVVVADENYDNWIANGNQSYLVPYVVKYSDVAEDMAKYEY